jgi:hypothetical protein
MCVCVCTVCIVRCLLPHVLKVLAELGLEVKAFRLMGMRKVLDTYVSISNRSLTVYTLE